MNNFFVNKSTGFKLLAMTLLLFSGYNVLLGQQIKIAEDENQYFEDVHLGVQLRGLSTKYQYFIDQNEKLVKSGYFKAQMEYVDTYGGASLKTLYRISGNYNNGKKEGKWIYEVITFGLTLNFSKFNSDKWEYDHYKIDNSNEIASLYTATVEFKDDNPSGIATAKFKEKGQITFSVECTMKKNFIFGKFSGKGKDYDISGEFDNLGRIHGEWIIQKKGVNFIGDSYENLKQYNGLTVKKYYTHGVLNEYKVYTVNGELLEKCKNKLAEYLETNTVDANMLKIDTFYVLNAYDFRQDPICLRTDKADVLDNNYSNFSEKEPYYKIHRNCSKYSQNSKFELNLYVYNGSGIGFLYEAEKIYNSKTREILLSPIKSSENYKDLEDFLSTFSFYNNRNSGSINCGLVKLVDLSKTSQNEYFISRMYNFYQRISKVNTNNAILKVYENLDVLQNKICASNIYSKNNKLLGSNDMGEFLTGNTNKHESFNNEFNKLGGKCWKSIIKLDNTISAISKNLDTYIDIPHNTGNSSMNPKSFTSNIKQAILDSFYSSALEDIKDQNSIEELSQTLDETNNKLTESFIKLELRNKALAMVSKIEALEKERIAELERQSQLSKIKSNIEVKQKEVFKLYVVEDKAGTFGRDLINAALTGTTSDKVKMKTKKKSLFEAYKLFQKELLQIQKKTKTTADEIVVADAILDLNNKMIYLSKQKTKDLEKQLKNNTNTREIEKIFDGISVP
jgi:hypothetical protein